MVMYRGHQGGNLFVRRDTKQRNFLLRSEAWPLRNAFQGCIFWLWIRRNTDLILRSPFASGLSRPA
jgi:hypothetical protein